MRPGPSRARSIRWCRPILVIRMRLPLYSSLVYHGKHALVGGRASVGRGQCCSWKPGDRPRFPGRRSVAKLWSVPGSFLSASRCSWRAAPRSTGSATPAHRRGRAVFDPVAWPYFRSADEAVLGMLELEGTGPKDVVYDLGLRRRSAPYRRRRRTSARAVSASQKSDRAACAWRVVPRAPRRRYERPRARFVRGDLFEARHSARRRSVTLFPSYETLNRRLLPKLLRELAPGTRNRRETAYGFATAWPPERTVQAGGEHALSLDGSEALAPRIRNIVLSLPEGLGHHLQARPSARRSCPLSSSRKIIHCPPSSGSL